MSVPTAPGQAASLCVHQETLAQYDTTAPQFIARTATLDVAAARAIFLDRIPDGGHILDAGCGSGRDARAFADAGYEVTAIDGSPRLAALAAERTCLPVQAMTFDAIPWRRTFDGIWAMASLLHVPAAGLPAIFEILATALRPRGTLYCSFKWGESEGVEDGRYFTRLTFDRFSALIAPVRELATVSLWRDQDATRPDTAWLNALLTLRAPGE